MKKTIALIGSICLFSIFNSAYAAPLCTVSGNTGTVNLRQGNTGVITTKVNFKNCTQRVRPSFEWLNKNGQYGAFYLNNKPDTYIPVGFNNRMGGTWDGTYPVVGASTSASSGTYNFDTYFGSSSASKNLELYTQISISNFDNLQNYLPGTYHTSMIFSVNTF